MKTDFLGMVRDELNHIYTEPPFFVHGGNDLGWFCREHAIHTYSLLCLLGEDPEIVIGDFAIVLGDGRIFTSLRDDSDHAWCVVKNANPLDLSASTRHLEADSKEIGGVWGQGNTPGDYSVTLSNDDSSIILDRLKKLDAKLSMWKKKKGNLIQLIFKPIHFNFCFRPRQGTLPSQISTIQMYFSRLLGTAIGY